MPIGAINVPAAMRPATTIPPTPAATRRSLAAAATLFGLLVVVSGDSRVSRFLQGWPAPAPLTGAACLVALDRIQQSYQAVAAASGRCGGEHHLRVRELGRTTLSSPATLSCPLLVSLNQFDSSTLQPLAKTHFAQPVAAIAHVGGYACRGVRGNPEIPSQHAFANALDITEFTLADGTAISVSQHWHAPGPAGRFLRQVASGAGRHFTTVLTPDYDSRHADHFHFGHRARPDAVDALANLLSKELYKGDARPAHRTSGGAGAGPSGSAADAGQH